MVRRYAALVGHENFAPHDARRSCARIYYDAKAPLEQICLIGSSSGMEHTFRRFPSRSTRAQPPPSFTSRLQSSARRRPQHSDWPQRATRHTGRAA